MISKEVFFSLFEAWKNKPLELAWGSQYRVSLDLGENVTIVVTDEIGFHVILDHAYVGMKDLIIQAEVFNPSLIRVENLKVLFPRDLQFDNFWTQIKLLRELHSEPVKITQRMSYLDLLLKEKV